MSNEEQLCLIENIHTQSVFAATELETPSSLSFVIMKQAKLPKLQSLTALEKHPFSHRKSTKRYSPENKIKQNKPVGIPAISG